MSCPYETGDCEYPQDCEDCNPDLYAERCSECNGFLDREDWEGESCECEAEEEEEDEEARKKRLFVQRLSRGIDWELMQRRSMTHDEKVQMWRDYRAGF